ncbi:hypothetical protein I4F81_000611 [Pyropia yezoensis]|uniref:Uncharacterized protein n=1 Tax=Pyropia yezoensis TaxID=2788 RepID=A0ACC3BKG9_PYRYE|nr:hypothetical protein I4F81_000611 [Neopyropia yezoensis]
MVAAASMVHALHAASVYLAPATLLSPMRADLGLTVSQISLPLNVYRLINAVLLVPAGAVLDRSRPDAILRTSVIAAAVLAMALPFCNNLPQLVALQAAFAVTKLFGGLTAMLLLVSRAFGDRPGASTDRLGRLDAAGAPTPTTGSVASPRASPADGAAPLSSAAECDAATDVTPRLLTPPYLALLAVVASFSFSMHVVLDHLLVFLREDFGGSGLHLDVAARYLSALNLGALVTKLGVGPLADRYDKGLLMACFGVLGAIASAFLFDWVGGALLLTSSPVQMGAFVGLYAVAYAGVFSLSTAALQDFGTARLGLRCNLNLVALFAAGSVGSYVAGALRTHFGSYVWSFVASGASWAGVVGAALAYTAAHRAMRAEGGGGGGGGGGGSYRKLPTAPGGSTGRAR